MKIKLIFITFLLFIFTFGVSLVQASTITVTDISGIATTYNQNSSTKTSHPGEFILESDILAQPFGYCVEQGVSIWNGPFNVLNLYELSGYYVNAAWLVDTYATTLTENYQRAGLQLAIWDVLGDGDINDIDSIVPSEVQTFFTTIQSEYSSKLNNGYNYADDVKGKGYKIAELQWEDWDLNIQDLIVQTPVPEPATMLLFGLGLLGITAIGRKRS